MDAPGPDPGAERRGDDAEGSGEQVGARDDETGHRRVQHQAGVRVGVFGHHGADQVFGEVEPHPGHALTQLSRHRRRSVGVATGMHGVDELRSAGADVVSGGEPAASLESGFPHDRIVFSGVGKTKGEIAAGVAAEKAALFRIIGEIADTPGIPGYDTGDSFQKFDAKALRWWNTSAPPMPASY